MILTYILGKREEVALRVNTNIGFNPLNNDLFAVFAQ